jgi:hypothetical protein
MRWLYNNYNKDYKKYKEAKSTYCRRVLKQNLDDFLKKDISILNEKEKIFLNIYLRNNPLLDSDCLMNKICLYMEKSVKQMKESRQSINIEDIINLIKDASLHVENLEEKLKSMDMLYQKYKKHKQTLSIISDNGSEEKFKTIDQYNKYIRQQSYTISSNVSELANLAIAICYVGKLDRSFAWNLFGEGIVQNVMKGKQEKIMIPFLDANGDIDYLGNNYSLFEIIVNEENNNDYLL